MIRGVCVRLGIGDEVQEEAMGLAVFGVVILFNCLP